MFLSFHQDSIIKHANDLESRIFVIYSKPVKSSKTSCLTVIGEELNERAYT